MCVCAAKHCVAHIHTRFHCESADCAMIIDTQSPNVKQRRETTVWRMAALLPAMVTRCRRVAAAAASVHAATGSTPGHSLSEVFYIHPPHRTHATATHSGTQACRTSAMAPSWDGNGATDGSPFTTPSKCHPIALRV